jgi:hypothetical protein
MLSPEQAIDPHTFLDLYASFLVPAKDGAAAAVSRIES